MENTRPQTTLLPWQSLLASRQHATNACQAEPHTLGSRVISDPNNLTEPHTLQFFVDGNHRPIASFFFIAITLRHDLWPYCVFMSSNFVKKNLVCKHNIRH